jgi:hypothetical protein
MKRFRLRLVAGATLFLLAASCGVFSGISVDFVCPGMGKGDDIPGHLYNVVDPTQYKVLILVCGRIGAWYDKTHIQPDGKPQPDPVEAVPIKADGTFLITNWAGVGTWRNQQDYDSPYIGIWVVPISFDTRWFDENGQPVYQVENGSPIPDKVTAVAIASCVKNRSNEAVPTAPRAVALPTRANNTYDQISVYKSNGQKLADISVVNSALALDGQLKTSGVNLARGAYLAVCKNNGSQVAAQRIMVTGTGR